MGDRNSMFSKDGSMRGLFTTVVGALAVALILAMFALFRDVDMMRVMVTRNSADVSTLQGTDSEQKADIREIRVKLETVARIETKLDTMLARGYAEGN